MERKNVPTKAARRHTQGKGFHGGERSQIGQNALTDPAYLKETPLDRYHDR